MNIRKKTRFVNPIVQLENKLVATTDYSTVARSINLLIQEKSKKGIYLVIYDK